MTLLRRLGNKSAIAEEIIRHFPPHKIYIEPFFGAGGMFFAKPKAPYNIVNDKDDDVVNLFDVIIKRKEELIEKFSIMPHSQTLLKRWQKQKETTPIMKAIRFLMVSNFTMMGKQSGSMKLGTENTKASILNMIEATHKVIFDVQFTCMDFRKMLKSIPFREEEEKVFSYNDPPYLGTDNNYSHSFKENDTIDCVEANKAAKIKYAISEFDSPFIIDLAKSYSLNIIQIGERQNIKNRRTEILLTNYELTKTLF